MLTRRYVESGCSPRGGRTRPGHQSADYETQMLERAALQLQTELLKRKLVRIEVITQ